MPDQEIERDYKVLRRLIDALPDGAMTTTADGVIIEANPAAHKLFHRAPAELHGSPVFSYLEDEYGKPLESVIGRIIKGFGEVRNRHVYVKWGPGDDDRISCCMTVYPLIESREDGERYIDRVVGIFRDQTEVEKLVTVDPLTKLQNQHGLTQHLDEYVLLARRKGWPLAIAYIDLNKFKPVNDRFGHKEGDRALLKFGDRLKKFTFDTDIRARIHGDEFIVLLVKPERERLEEIAAKLVEATRFDVDLRGSDQMVVVDISASIGICWREGAGIPEDPKLFLELADKAMYVCKKSGGEMDYYIDANGTHGP